MKSRIETAIATVTAIVTATEPHADEGSLAPSVPIVARTSVISDTLILPQAT